MQAGPQETEVYFFLSASCFFFPRSLFDTEVGSGSSAREKARTLWRSPEAVEATYYIEERFIEKFQTIPVYYYFYLFPKKTPLLVLNLE